MTWQRMSRSESVGVERYVRPLENGEQFGLIGVQPRQQAIECDEAGAAAKDAIEACTLRRRTVGAMSMVSGR
jgi:hypothetical protein